MKHTFYIFLVGFVAACSRDNDAAIAPPSDLAKAPTVLRAFLSRVPIAKPIELYFQGSGVFEVRPFRGKLGASDFADEPEWMARISTLTTKPSIEFTSTPRSTGNALDSKQIDAIVISTRSIVAKKMLRLPSIIECQRTSGGYLVTFLDKHQSIGGFTIVRLSKDLKVVYIEGGH